MDRSKTTFINKIAASLAAALLCAGLFIAAPAAVNAEVTLSGALPASTAPSSGTSFATTGALGGQYTAPPGQDAINTRVQTAYTSSKVCLITQDPAYDPGSKSGTTVATANVVYDSNKYANVPVIYLAGGNYSNTSMKKVVSDYDVLFFGSGIFTDTDSLDTATQNKTSALFSKEGLCIIGAQPISNNSGQSTVLKRVSNVRYLFANANIFIDSIVFDGNGKPLPNDKNNGFNYIDIASGSSGFYMRNCTVQNIAAQALVPGVAINADAPGGQVNLEKVTVNNVASGGGYANVQLNDCANMNIRDMTVILPQGSAMAAIAIESSSQNPTIQPSVSFSGYVNISRASVANRAGAGQKYIEVEDYNTGTLTLPDNYPYAVFYSNGTVRLYQDEADIDYNGGALFDVKDQCWIVNQSTADYEIQLANVSAILQNMNQNRQLGPDGSPQFSSDAFIKIIPDSSGVLKGFSLPDFATAKAHIRALSASDTSFVAPFSSAGSAVAFSGDAAEQIEFPATNAANITLYGINFDKTSHYTLQEVLRGGTSETKKPIAVGATKDNFVQCAFTSLAASLVITSSPTSLQVNTTGYAQAKIDSVYLANGYTLPASSSVKPNDASLEWISSDARVAAIDNNGNIQALAAGTVTITAKAKDAYNHGEIAKPSASFRLTVTTVPVSVPISTPSPPASTAVPPAAPSSSAASSRAVSASAASSSSTVASSSSSTTTSNVPISIASSTYSAASSTTPANEDNSPSPGLRGPKWALANLILSLCSIVIALLLFIQCAFRKREEESSIEDAVQPESHPENGNLALRIAILAAALLSVILFILTESLRLPMTFVDRWTPVMLLFPIVQIVLVLILRKNDRTANGDDTQGTDLYE